MLMRVEVVDWWRVITDLEKAGWTHERIGRELGVHKSTVTAWKRGVEPRHSDGARLLDLLSGTV